MVDIAQAAEKSQSPLPPPPPPSGAASPPPPDPLPMLKQEAILPKENLVVTTTVNDKSPDEVMNAVLDATSPTSVTTTVSTPPPTVEPPARESSPLSAPSGSGPAYEKPKKRSSVVPILLTMILLLAAIGIGGYYVSQQQQLAEIRSRAVGPYPSNSPTPVPISTCSGALESCESTPCCSGQNFVCQGVSGSRKCQQTGDGGSGDSFCKSNASNPGLGCNRYRGHKCSNLTNSQCVQNGQNFATWAQAVAYSQGCGQADVVCNEGSKDGQLCGDFAIFNSTCGTSTTSTPTPPVITNTPTRPPTPTPVLITTNTPTPVQIGLACESIRVYDQTGASITEALRNGTRKLALGETVILATPKAGATKARFRIQGITQFAENNPALSGGSILNEYRLAIQIPTTITQTQATFEAEIFIANAWH